MKCRVICPHGKKNDEFASELTAVSSSDAFGPHIELLDRSGHKIVLMPTLAEINELHMWINSVKRRNVQ